MLKVHAEKLNTTEILGLEGQIAYGQTESLRRAVQLTPNASAVVLDLANVNIVDAHGLGVLLQLREQLLARGAQFELINVSKALYRIFEITRLNTVFAINGDVRFSPRIAPAMRMPVAA